MVAPALERITTRLSMSGVVSRLMLAGTTCARTALSGDTNVSGATFRQLPSGRGFDRRLCPLHGLSASTSVGSSVTNAVDATDAAVRSERENALGNFMWMPLIF